MGGVGGGLLGHTPRGDAVQSGLSDNGKGSLLHRVKQEKYL